MKNIKKGFTLIELLVVIAIIGILSGVVLASLNTARQKARNAQRISDIRQVVLALELYQDATGAYPTDPGGPVAIPAVLSPDYLPVIPTEVTTGQNAYRFASVDGLSFCVGADLEGTFVAPRNADATCLPAGGSANELDGTIDFAVSQ